MLIFILPTASQRPPSRLIRRCHPYARKSASKAFLSRMQLTLHATRPTPHGASLCLVLALSCLVGQNPTCSVPALQGCEGLRSYDHSIERHEYTPYSPPSFFPVESGPIRYIRSLYVHLAGRNNSKPSRPLQHPNPSRLLQYGRGSILNFALRRSWQD